MNTFSDKTIRKILITGLAAMIIIISLFALTAYSLSGSGIIIGGRITNIISAPTVLHPAPDCPGPPKIGPNNWLYKCGAPLGDLPLRQIDGMYQSNTLADVSVYGPSSARQYRHILIPKSSRYCPSPRVGNFFLGKGVPVGPGGNAVLMTAVGCSR